MASLIERVQRRVDTTTEEPRVLDIRDAPADEVFDALSPETRRGIYRSLFTQPQTTSELADNLDMSIQNVQYHLEPLKTAGLVEAVDTIYSEKGNEMTVFAPANDPLVIVGNEDHTAQLEDALPRILTGIGLLGIASLLVQWVGTRFVTLTPATDSGLTPASPESTVVDPGMTLIWLVFDVLEPGLVFFVGTILVVAVAVRLQRSR